MPKRFSGESGVARKDFVAVFILLLNVFAWFCMTLMMVNNALGALNVRYPQN